ncbi:hypothetical protein PENSPDRAFT_695242, partial [Peniophora sp. CONT]
MFGYRPCEPPSRESLNLMGLPETLPEPKPPSEPLVYPELERSRHSRPTLPVLQATAPGVPHIEALRYPESSIWMLEKSDEHARGWRYVTTFYTSARAEERERLLSTVSHPHLHVQGYDKETQLPIIPETVPGSLKAIAGVPFVVRIDGKQDHEVTVLGIATPETCSGYRSWDGPDGLHEVTKHFVQVALYGQEGNADLRVPPSKPIWQYNLERNTRSATSMGDDQPYDGSFNIASTRTEGHGAGFIRPAVQCSEPGAVGSQWVLNNLLGKMLGMVLPQFVSRRELEGARFYCEVQNVPGIGGSGWANSAVQLNISSVIVFKLEHSDSLARSLGALQGRLHTDYHDDFRLWTMCTLLLRLPDGADPGAFLFARPGIYVRETNTIVLFLVFKGNDLHGGQAPAAAEAVLKAWEAELAELLRAQGGLFIVSREMWVVYPSDAANQRKAGMALTPRVAFGNCNPVSPNDDRLQNFALHGRHILGNNDDFHNFMGRDLVFAFYNAAKLVGFEELDINMLLAALRYRSEDPNRPALVPCRPMDDFNITTEEGRRSYERGLQLYVWLDYLAQEYYCGIGKKEHNVRVNRIAAAEVAATPSLSHLDLEVQRPIDFTRPIHLQRRARRSSSFSGRDSNDTAVVTKQQLAPFQLPARTKRKHAGSTNSVISTEKAAEKKRQKEQHGNSNSMEEDEPDAFATSSPPRHAEHQPAGPRAARSHSFNEPLSELSELPEEEDHNSSDDKEDADSDGEPEASSARLSALPKTWDRSKIALVEWD